MRMGLGLNTMRQRLTAAVETALAVIDYETPSYQVSGTTYASDTALPGYVEVGTSTDRVFTMTNPDSTDRDFLIWGKATIPAGATEYRMFALYKDGSNNFYVRRTVGNAVQLASTDTAALEVNITQGSITTGELRWAVRQKAGKMSLHTRIATTTVHSAETTATPATLLNALHVAHFNTTTPNANGTLKLLYSNGAFSDAEVAAKLLAL